MIVTHWLRCTGCDALYRDVEVEYESLPSCPECGAPTRITWEHGHAPQVKLFAPRVLDTGVSFESKEEWNRYKAELEARHPGKKVVVEPDSPAARKRRADEVRHRARQEWKKQGISEQEVASWKKEQRKAEALKRGDAVKSVLVSRG